MSSALPSSGWGSSTSAGAVSSCPGSGEDCSGAEGAGVLVWTKGVGVQRSEVVAGVDSDAESGLLFDFRGGAEQSMWKKTIFETVRQKN